MTDKSPPAVPDWAALVARARDSGPGELLHELIAYRVWFDTYAGGFKAENYPPEVMAYLRELHAPTGKRGRPKPRSGRSLLPVIVTKPFGNCSRSRSALTAGKSTPQGMNTRSLGNPPTWRSPRSQG